MSELRRILLILEPTNEGQLRFEEINVSHKEVKKWRDINADYDTAPEDILFELLSNKLDLIVNKIKYPWIVLKPSENNLICLMNLTASMRGMMEFKVGE